MYKRKVHLAAMIMIAVLAAICLTEVAAYADLYKYTDSNGVVSITDDRNAVPSRYRATMKVVRDDTKKNGTGGQTREPASPAQEPSAAGVEEAPAVAAEPTSSMGRLMAAHPWLKPLLVVVGIGVGFLAVVKLTTLLPSPQLAKLIYLVFFFGVFTFGYKCYADYLVNSYLTIKTKVIGMFKKSNERQAPELGEKAAAPVTSGNDDLNKIAKP